MTDGQILKQFVENQSRSVKSIYTQVGVSKAAWYEYYKAVSMEPGTKARIEKCIGRRIFDIDVNIDPDKKNAPQSDFKADPGGEFQNAELRGLIESNRMMAAAMLADAESRAMLTKSNAELTLMVRQSVNVRPETSEALTAILPGLQKILVEFGMGRLWKNQREGQLKVSRWLFGSQQKVSAGHIHDDLGK